MRVSCIRQVLVSPSQWVHSNTSHWHWFLFTLDGFLQRTVVAALQFLRQKTSNGSKIRICGFFPISVGKTINCNYGCFCLSMFVLCPEWLLYVSLRWLVKNIIQCVFFTGHMTPKVESWAPYMWHFCDVPVQGCCWKTSSLLAICGRFFQVQVFAWPVFLEIFRLCKIQGGIETQLQM